MKRLTTETCIIIIIIIFINITISIIIIINNIINAEIFLMEANILEIVSPETFQNKNSCVNLFARNKNFWNRDHTKAPKQKIHARIFSLQTKASGTTVPKKPAIKIFMHESLCLNLTFRELWVDNTLK